MTQFPEWSGPNAPDVSSLPQLNVVEAFDTLQVFIENHWKRGLMVSDDLRWLLSAMKRDCRFWADGGPSDPAMWSDWIEAVGLVKQTDLSAEANRTIRYAEPGN